MQRGLVRDGTSQERVAISCLGAQSGEGTQHGRAEVTQRVEQAFAGMDGQERDSAELRNVIAALRRAQDDPKAATVALAPVIDGSAPLVNAHLAAGQPDRLRPR